MPEREDELRRLVEDAARAARAAEAAAERLEREQPSRFESVMRGISELLRTLFDALFGRLRAEIEGARRSGEELVARVLLALSRAAQHFARALALAFTAALLLTIGFVVFTIALVVLLNERLGDPWGTLAVAGLFLVGALAAGVGARARLRAIGDDARTLAPRLR